MRLDGNITDYLASALASAKRLRGKRVYRETRQFWNDLLAEARRVQASGEVVSTKLEWLADQLEAELKRDVAEQ